MENTIKVAVGCLWEGYPWEIKLDCDCSEHGGPPCPHSYDFKTLTHPTSTGSTFQEKVWKNPVVLVAYNEGSCNSTGLCWLCVKEFMAGIDMRLRGQHP